MNKYNICYYYKMPKIIVKKNKGGCKTGRKEEEKGGCKIGKKKIKFNVVGRREPIPTNNIEGLELMKIPYIGGGVQARPEELLDQINLNLVGMTEAPSIGKKLTGLSREEMNKLSPLELFGMLPVELAVKEVLNPKITGVKVGKLIEEDAEEREEISGIKEFDGDRHYTYYSKGEVIKSGDLNGNVSVADFIHVTQNFTQIVENEPGGLSIAYGNEREYDIETNQERYAGIMKEFREEYPDEDEYPEDHDWDLDHTYDKVFDTGRKDEDFKNLRKKMDRYKEKVFNKNPEFAEYFKGIEKKHGKKIKEAWDDDMDEIGQSPFTLKTDIRMDLGGYGTHQEDPDQDWYFYDEDSMDSYFDDWKGYLKELVENYSEKKQYL